MSEVISISKVCNRVAMAAAVTLGSSCSTTTKTPRGPSQTDGVVRLYSNHLKEDAVVTSGNDPDLDTICRDRRDETVKDMDPALYGKLVKIQVKLEDDGYEDLTFNIVSCYRSPATNEHLRETRGGQAKNSQHIEGKAIDIQITATYGGQRVTVPIGKVWDAACEVRSEDGFGGLGYYPGNKFVHVDTRPGDDATWGNICLDAA